MKIGDLVTTDPCGHDDTDTAPIGVIVWRGSGEAIGFYQVLWGDGSVEFLDNMILYPAEVINESR